MTKRTLTYTLGTLALLLSSPTAALAGQSNTAATSAYIHADHALLQVTISHLAASEAAPLHVLAQARAECPQAAALSPQDSQSTEMSDEVIGTMVLDAGHPDLGAIHTYLAATRHLSWSNGGLTRAIRSYVSRLTVTSAMTAPALCADVKAWAADEFKSLTPATVSFVKRFMPNWVTLGELPRALAQYETSSDRALASQCAHWENLIVEAEARAVEHWEEIMNEIGIHP